MGAVLVQAASREGLGWRFAARARTSNIQAMLVTLDVSKLSGWLNFVAYCRVAGTAHEAGRGVGREAKGLWARCWCKPHAGKGRLEVRGEGTHPKHAVHVCDAGRVKAQRLVELLRALPSRRDGT